MTHEGLPTAARNLVHAVDFKIAVPLVQVRTIAVVEGPGSLTKIFWTEQDFINNKLKVTKTKPTEINKGFNKTNYCAFQ